MKTNEKTIAIKLRQKGISLSEISKRCEVSKSTVSVWVKDVVMSDKSLIILSGNASRNWEKAMIARKIKREKEQRALVNKMYYYLTSRKEIGEYSLLLCSLLYWCEGEKGRSGVRFTNSDPDLVSSFLTLLRKSFKIDNSKLRACLHLHSYHDELTQKKFWSTITDIPSDQFYKVYWKKSGGKILKENYPGCISVRYYDNKVLSELIELYKIFGKIRGVV